MVRSVEEGMIQLIFVLVNKLLTDAEFFWRFFSHERIEDALVALAILVVQMYVIVALIGWAADRGLFAKRRTRHPKRGRTQ